MKTSPFNGQNLEGVDLTAHLGQYLIAVRELRADTDLTPEIVARAYNGWAEENSRPTVTVKELRATWTED